MTGVAIELTVEGLEAALAMGRGLASYDIEDRAFEIGELLVGSTKDRIDTEKTSPDGLPWEPWSRDYAATRQPRHSLLVGDGDLRDSIANYSEGGSAIVGSNLIYAAIHQFGGDEVGINIPARPYLGLSEEDEADIRDLILDDLEDITHARP